MVEILSGGCAAYTKSPLASNANHCKISVKILSGLFYFAFSAQRCTSHGYALKSGLALWFLQVSEAAGYQIRVYIYACIYTHSKVERSDRRLEEPSIRLFCDTIVPDTLPPSSFSFRPSSSRYWLFGSDSLPDLVPSPRSTELFLRWARTELELRFLTLYFLSQYWHRRRCFVTPTATATAAVAMFVPWHAASEYLSSFCGSLPHRKEFASRYVIANPWIVNRCHLTWFSRFAYNYRFGLLWEIKQV